MNTGTAPLHLYGSDTYPQPLTAHVPPKPEPDTDPEIPPGIPPETPDEVDLPPREEPQKIDDPTPNKSRLAS